MVKKSLGAVKTPKKSLSLDAGDADSNNSMSKAKSPKKLKTPKKEVVEDEEMASPQIKREKTKSPKKLKTPKKEMMEDTEFESPSPQKRRKSEGFVSSPKKKKMSTFTPQPAKSKKLPKKKSMPAKAEEMDFFSGDISEADMSDSNDEEFSGEEGDEEKLFDEGPCSDTSDEESEEEKLYDDVPLSDTSEDEDEIEKTKTERKKKTKDFLKKNAGKTIFVGNLPKTITADQVKQFFKKYGAIETARLRCAPVADTRIRKKVAVITKQFHESRNNISAFVVYKEEASATKALKANGEVIQGHHIRVDCVAGKSTPDKKKAVFLGNLPFGIEEDKLWEVFGSCGDIESVRLIRDAMTNLGKGIGYINFKTSDAVELALMKSGMTILKRSIRVERCGEAPSRRKDSAMKKNKRLAMRREKKPNKPKRPKKPQHKEVGGTADNVQSESPKKAAAQDNSFQGQKVKSGKVGKKDQGPKMNSKKKQVVEALVNTIKKEKKVKKVKKAAV